MSPNDLVKSPTEKKTDFRIVLFHSIIMSFSKDDFGYVFQVYIFDKNRKILKMGELLHYKLYLVKTFYTNNPSDDLDLRFNDILEGLDQDFEVILCEEIDDIPSIKISQELLKSKELSKDSIKSIKNKKIDYFSLIPEDIKEDIKWQNVIENFLKYSIGINFNPYQQKPTYLSSDKIKELSRSYVARDYNNPSRSIRYYLTIDGYFITLHHIIPLDYDEEIVTDEYQAEVPCFSMCIEKSEEETQYVKIDGDVGWGYGYTWKQAVKTMEMELIRRKLI